MHYRVDLVLTGDTLVVIDTTVLVVQLAHLFGSMTPNTITIIHD